MTSSVSSSDISETPPAPLLLDAVAASNQYGNMSGPNTSSNDSSGSGSRTDLHPVSHDEALTSYQEAIERSVIFTSLKPNQQAAYMIEAGLCQDTTTFGKTNRLWKKKESTYLKDTGVEIPLNDLSGTKTVSVTIDVMV